MCIAIQMIRRYCVFGEILVIGVACFNIVSTLVMAVKTKSGDIAVLRTLGRKRHGFVPFSPGTATGGLKGSWRGDRRCRFASATAIITGIARSGDRFCPAIGLSTSCHPNYIGWTFVTLVTAHG